MDTTYKNILPIVALFSDIAGPILERTFVWFYRKRAKKGQNIWKFGQKCTKFENILKKGNLMHVSITHMKQLQYALHRHIIHTPICKNWHTIACDTTLSTIWPSKPFIYLYKTVTFTTILFIPHKHMAHHNTIPNSATYITYIHPHTETHTL